MNFKEKNKFFFQLRELVGHGIDYKEILRLFKLSEQKVMKIDNLSFGDLLGREFKLSEFDIITINSFDKMGKLENGLDVLVLYYKELEDQISHFVSLFIQPMLLTLLAALILPLPAAINGELGIIEYCFQAYIPFLIIYLLYKRFIMKSLSQGTLIKDLPFLKKFLIAEYMLRWFYFNSLGKLIDSGIDLRTALDISHSYAKTEKLRIISRKLRSGIAQKTLSECFNGIYIEPEVHSWVVTYEKNGRFDLGFQKIAIWYQDLAFEKLKVLANWIPKIAYALVSIFIAYKILR